ncbi:MAG: HAMP domain-containing sensor histidine kinase [Candidatus Binatia bacterium]
MRLVRKFTLALVLGFMVIMACHALLQVSRDVSLFETDTEKDERTLGLALRSVLEGLAQEAGPVRARQVAEQVGRQHGDVHVRWVRLGAPLGDPDAPVLDPDSRGPLRAGQDITLVKTDESGEERRFTYVPLAIKGAGRVALEVSEALRPQRVFIRTTALWVLGATGLIVAGAGALALVVGAWFVGRPMRVLAEQARRVGHGDLSTRLELPQRDEIGELAHELDVMCDALAAARERVAAETEARIAALEQLRHADRLKTVGQLASGVAHELGTPLNVVGARAKMIAGAAPDATAVRNAQIIAQQAERMAAIIRQLLDFSRRKGPKLDLGDLGEIAAQTADLLSSLAHGRGVTVRVERPAEPVMAHVDRHQLQQALTNLIVNGLQASARGRTLRVVVGRGRATPPLDHDAREDEYVHVTVEDEGTGIPREHLARLFEPFFTTKGVGEGTGLGLAVAYGIVREHGGWIAVDSAEGRGSQFTIHLVPAAATPPRAVGAVG